MHISSGHIWMSNGKSIDVVYQCDTTKPELVEWWEVWYDHQCYYTDAFFDGAMLYALDYAVDSEGAD